MKNAFANMIFRLTKKVQDKLKTGKLSSVPEGNLLNEWYVHVFMIKRYRYFLITHAASLFSVVVRSAGIVSEEQLFNVYFNELKEKLTEAGCDNFFEKITVFGLEDISLSNTVNRRILSSMNEMILCLQIISDDDEYSPDEMSASINKTIFSFINWYSPTEFIKNANSSNK